MPQLAKAQNFKSVSVTGTTDKVSMFGYLRITV